MDKAIVHIITKLELGGAQINTLETVKFLGQRGKDAYIICGKGGYFDKQIGKYCKNYYFCNYLKREIDIISDYKALLEIIKYLKEIRNKHKRIIIHTHSSKAGILGRVAGCLSRCDSIVHTYHGFGFNDFQFFMKKYFFILIEFLVSFITDKLIFVSKENMEKAIKYRILRKEKKGLIIRSGIKFQRIESEGWLIKNIRKEYQITDEFVIATISCFKKQKNLSAVIEIARELKREGIKFKWIIFGDGIEKNKFMEKRKENHLEDMIILPGWDEEANKKIIISDIFVLTSIFEGLPRALLEAMSLGKPAIVSDIDGNRDIIKNNYNGYLIRVNDYNGFKEKIKSLYYDISLRREIGLNAKKSVREEFNIETMFKELEKLYGTF